MKFDGAQVSVRELLVYSRNSCGALVRDPGAKPVVPLGMWSFALPVSFAASFSAQQVVCDAALGCAYGELVGDAVVVCNSFWAAISSAALLRKDVKFDSYDLVLVPEPGRCFELCPVVFSDLSQLAWMLTTTMVFPSGVVFHSKACVSSLVLDASSSWDCALPVLHPTARRYNQKDQKQLWKVKEGQYCLGFPYHSTGSVAAAAAAFIAAVKRLMEDAAAASLCATNLPEIALSVFWFLSCFDVFGTVVVPSFLHGLLRGGHVLGLRFGRASAAAASFAALMDMVAHQFCSCTAAAFVGVFT